MGRQVGWRRFQRHPIIRNGMTGIVIGRMEPALQSTKRPSSAVALHRAPTEGTIARVASWLERYKSGETERVWVEMRARGAAIREGALFEDAMAVARETMRRVRSNAETVHGRLSDIGYAFERSAGALVSPGPRIMDDDGSRRGGVGLPWRRDRNGDCRRCQLGLLERRGGIHQEHSEVR